MTLQVLNAGTLQPSLTSEYVPMSDEAEAVRYRHLTSVGDELTDDDFASLGFEKVES